jgi:hypothetical protein
MLAVLRWLTPLCCSKVVHPILNRVFPLPHFLSATPLPPPGIEYSGYVAVPYNDETLLPVNDTWHPKIDDVVYNAMDWDCPGYNQVP